MSDIEEYLPSWQPTRARSLRWLGMGLVAVVVIVGAGAGGVLAADRPGDAGSTVNRAAPASPGPPSPSAAPSPSVSAAAPVPPATSSTRIPPTLGFPPVLNVKYGDRYWAVFLAVTGVLDDPLQEQAVQQALAAGYAEGDPVFSSVSCQQGAREGLAGSGAPLDSARDYAALLLRFGTRQEAAAFVDAYEPPVVGTVQVTWSCTG